MISREDWDAAYRESIAEGRRRAGSPPTFDEVEALSRGELSEVEAERVRESLSCYPDLLRVVTEPFPTDTEGVLTSEELASDLAKIRQRIHSIGHPMVQPAAPVVFPRKRWSGRFLAIAAGVVIAFAIGGIVLRRTMIQPREIQTLVLYPESMRGSGSRGMPAGAPVTLSTDLDYELHLVYESRQHYSQYSLEIVTLETESPRRVWSREHVVPAADGTFVASVAPQDLGPGLYQVALYGWGNREPLAKYTIRIVPR